MSPVSKLIIVVLFLLVAVPASACFGPKLYLGVDGRDEGELLFHLVAIYVKEKTGVESLRVDLVAGQDAVEQLRQQKIDLGFHPQSSPDWPTILTLGPELYLLNGPRPTDDLQFTTVPKALGKLDRLLKADDLEKLRKQVADGVLPASAVRSLYMQRGWI